MGLSGKIDTVTRFVMMTRGEDRNENVKSLMGNKRCLGATVQNRIMEKQGK